MAAMQQLTIRAIIMINIPLMMTVMITMVNKITINTVIETHTDMILRTSTKNASLLMEDTIILILVLMNMKSVKILIMNMAVVPSLRTQDAEDACQPQELLLTRTWMTFYTLINRRESTCKHQVTVRFHLLRPKLNQDKANHAKEYQTFPLCLRVFQTTSTERPLEKRRSAVVPRPRPSSSMVRSESPRLAPAAAARSTSKQLMEPVATMPSRL
jgi:hypothetical protein